MTTSISFFLSCDVLTYRNPPVDTPFLQVDISLVYYKDVNIRNGNITMKTN